METIKDIDRKILDLEKQIQELRLQRNRLQLQNIHLVGKYFKVTNFGSNYIYYIYVDRLIPNRHGITVRGKKYTILLTDARKSVEYQEDGMLEYDIIPEITSNIFEEITKDIFISAIKDALGIVGI